jgi:hypothetical protein
MVALSESLLRSCCVVCSRVLPSIRTQDQYHVYIAQEPCRCEIRVYLHEIRVLFSGPWQPQLTPWHNRMLLVLWHGRFMRARPLSAFLNIACLSRCINQPSSYFSQRQHLSLPVLKGESALSVR